MVALLHTVFVLSLVIVCAEGFNCTGRVTGVYEAACQSAVICNNSLATKLECIQPLVINEQTASCDDPFNVNSPCGTFRDCSALDDGGYPDLDFDCHWYYVCSYGILYNHHKCATGLVWNSVIQTCDFPRNVQPPCGTNQ